VSLPAGIVDVSDEALSLVESYSAHGVLGSRFYNDMLHIGLRLKPCQEESGLNLLPRQYTDMVRGQLKQKAQANAV